MTIPQKMSYNNRRATAVTLVEESPDYPDGSTNTEGNIYSDFTESEDEIISLSSRLESLYESIVGFGSAPASVSNISGASSRSALTRQTRIRFNPTVSGAGSTVSFESEPLNEEDIQILEPFLQNLNNQIEQLPQDLQDIAAESISLTINGDTDLRNMVKEYNEIKDRTYEATYKEIHNFITSYRDAISHITRQELDKMWTSNFYKEENDEEINRIYTKLKRGIDSTEMKERIEKHIRDITEQTASLIKIVNSKERIQAYPAFAEDIVGKLYEWVNKESLTPTDIKLYMAATEIAPDTSKWFISLKDEMKQERNKEFENMLRTKYQSELPEGIELTLDELKQLHEAVWNETVQPNTGDIWETGYIMNRLSDDDIRKLNAIHVGFVFDGSADFLDGVYNRYKLINELIEMEELKDEEIEDWTEEIQIDYNPKNIELILGYIKENHLEEYNKLDKDFRNVIDLQPYYTKQVFNYLTAIINPSERKRTFGSPEWQKKLANKQLEKKTKRKAYLSK